MGIFPAAAFLKNHSFDLLALLREPSWIDAGPNTYAISPLTWLIALLMALFEPARVFVIVHLLQFSLYLVLYSQVRKLYEEFSSSAVIALVAVFHPVMLVQSGYMYSEIAVTLCSVVAIRMLLCGRVGAASFLGILATSLKHAGVIVAGASIVYLLVTRPKNWLRNCLVLGGPSLGMFALNTLIMPKESSVLADAPNYSAFLMDTMWRLGFVPELPILMVISLLVSIGVLGASMRHKIESKTAVAMATVIITFVAFYALVPMVATMWFLPRYFCQVLPFGVGLVFFALAQIQRLPQAATLILATGLTASGIIVAKFPVYPEFNGTAFSVIERDLRYRDAVMFQMLVSSAAAGLPDDAPKYVSREMYYFLTTPELGYVAKPVPNVHFVLVDPVEWPAEQPIYLVMSNATHGGRELNVAAQQSKAQGRKGAFYPIEHKVYRGGILQVSQ